MTKPMDTTKQRKQKESKAIHAFKQGEPIKNAACDAERKKSRKEKEE